MAFPDSSSVLDKCQSATIDPFSRMDSVQTRGIVKMSGIAGCISKTR